MTRQELIESLLHQQRQVTFRKVGGDIRTINCVIPENDEQNDPEYVVVHNLDTNGYARILPENVISIEASTLAA